MSEKKNSSKLDPNQDGIAREPEAPDAKNNDDQSVNMDEDDMMSSDEEDMIDTKDVSKQASQLDVEKGITPNHKKIGDQNLKLGSSFTQNIGKGNELDNKNALGLGVLHPNEIILEEIIQAGEDTNENTVQQQTAAFQEKKMMQESIKQQEGIFEDSATNQDVKIGQKKSKSGRESGRDSQRKRDRKNQSVNSLNSSSYKPEDVPDDGHEVEPTDQRSKFLKFAIPGFVVTFVLVIMLVSFLALQGNDDKIISSRADTTDYDTIAKVTAKCYFDIRIGDSDKGKITIGLFGNEVPQTVRNFKELCSGSFGKSQSTNTDLTYTGSKFYKIVSDAMAVGGDINGLGGESIFGKPFANENYKLKHSVPFLLSTFDPSGGKTSTSQFMITFKASPWLDGVNQKNVVFGQVIDGFNILQLVQNVGTVSGIPSNTVKIKQSGEIPMNL